MFVWHHHSLPIIQYFSYYLWALYLSPSTVFFFPSSVSKLTEPSEKKKKKKKPRTDRTSERRRKKRRKKEEEETQEKKGKKKSQKVVKRCGWVLFVGSLCVFNYNIAIELWVMETENSQNLFSVSIIHNSKIRELSDGNRVMDFPNNLFAIDLTIFELWVMETEIWVMEIAKPNTPL